MSSSFTSRVVFFAIIAVIASAVAAGSAAAQTEFRFGLYGDQENPPVSTVAFGEAVGVLSADETTFELTVNHTVASPTASHIHLGEPGTNGGVVFDLGSPVSPIVAVWNPTPTQAADLLAGRLYVNVHSSAHPGGEVRGQIILDCRDSTINSGVGPTQRVLFLNGSSGGVAHLVDIDTVVEPFFWAAILRPSSGGNGRFVVHGNLQAPPGSIHVLPASVGRTCHPFLLSDGAAPVVIANNVGKEDLVGASMTFGTSVPDPAPAPTIFLQIVFPDANLPPGTTVTFQGVSIDPGSASPKNASTTNAVIARVF